MSKFFTHINVLTGRAGAIAARPIAIAAATGAAVHFLTPRAFTLVGRAPFFPHWGVSVGAGVAGAVMVEGGLHFLGQDPEVLSGAADKEIERLEARIMKATMKAAEAAAKKEAKAAAKKEAEAEKTKKTATK